MAEGHQCYKCYRFTVFATAPHQRWQCECCGEVNYAPKPELPPNPKTLAGATKPDLSLIPPVALHHMAMAFEDGARKYGPFNWRDRPVEARTYVAAGLRHFADWLDGKETSADADVHNMGHVMACAAIILDAQEQGTLIDNRPKPGKSEEVLLRLQQQKKAEAAEREKKG